MSEKNLPHFGVGPYLVLIIGIITIFSSIFSYYHLIPIYEINELNMVFFILGIILIILGIIFWIHALMISKIHSEIENNNLITTGIYSHVRHPIYAAFLYVSTGIILFSLNILLFILPLFFWAFLTVAMIKTEEKWLIDRYGSDYINYSKKVNRFIPKVI